MIAVVLQYKYLSNLVQFCSTQLSSVFIRYKDYHTSMNKTLVNFRIYKSLNIINQFHESNLKKRDINLVLTEIIRVHEHAK